MFHKRKNQIWIIFLNAVLLFLYIMINLNIEKKFNDEELTFYMGNNEKNTTNTVTSDANSTYGNLKIIRQNCSDESNGTQIFIYKITSLQDENNVIFVSIPGNGSATINELLCGNYNVQQLNEWSWRYEGESQNINLTESGSVVTFEKTSNNEKWLSGSGNVITNSKKR